MVHFVEALENAAEMVFASDHVHAGEVVHLHVRLEHGQSLGVDPSVRPEEVEVCLFEVLAHREPPVQLALGCVLDTVVFGVHDVDYNLFASVGLAL